MLKFAWLEDWVNKGYLSEKDASTIYKECEKLASSLKGFEEQIDPDAIDQMIRGSSSGIGGALLGVVGGLFSEEEQEKAREKMKENREEIIEELEDKHEPEKIRARFDEIATLAPHVALDKDLIQKIMENKIQSGLTSEDAQGLTLLQSEFMAQEKSDDSGQDKESSVSPQMLGKMTADSYQIMSEMGAFKKVAGPFPGKADWLNYAGAMALGTSIPYLISAGSGAVKHVLDKKEEEKEKQELEQSFQKAVEYSDEEKEPLKADKEKAKQAFEALTHFAPNVAKQPQAARSFMNRMVSYDEGLVSSDLKDITQIESNIQASKKPSSFSQGFQAASGTVGLPNITAKAVEQASRSTQPSKGKSKGDVSTGSLGSLGDSS